MIPAFAAFLMRPRGEKWGLAPQAYRPKCLPPFLPKNYMRPFPREPLPPPSNARIVSRWKGSPSLKGHKPHHHDGKNQIER